MTPIAFQTDLDAQNRTIGSDVNRNGMPVVTDAIVPTRVDPMATTVKILRGKDKVEPAPPTPPEEPIAIAPLEEPIAIASPSKKLNAAAATEAAKEMLDIRRGAVYQSALRSSGGNPDADAKTLQAARDSGTSYNFVLQNMEQTQRRLFGREVAKLDLPKNAPVLAEKLATDPDFARIAIDDLSNLKEQEGWWSWFAHQVTGIPTAFMHGFSAYEHAESGATQVFGPSPLHPTMWSMADPQTFENRNAQLNAQELTFDPERETGWLPVVNMFGMTAYQFLRAVPAAGGGAIVGGVTGGLAGAAPLPWTEVTTPVTTLVGAQLGAKAGLSAALIEDQVRQGAGMMYNRMIDEGVDPNVARWKAASWGLALGGIQVGLMKVLYPKIATSILETQASKAAAEKLLAKKLAEAIADSSMKGAVKRISAQSAKTTANILAHVGGTVLMFEAGNEDARRASNLPMRSASPEGREEIIDSAVQGFKFMAIGSVGMHVLMPSAQNPIMGLARERSRIRAAEKQAEGFKTLSVLQKASKLAVRSPEDAQSLMEGTLTGTPIEDILISKEGIQRAMATLKIPMDKLDEVIPGALAQFNDVASGTAESGGYIKVKTADFKARIEKTTLGSLLLGDVTWSSEIGTLRESAARSAFLKTFISEINENVEKFADEVNEAINKDDANRESAEKVANVIEAQLIGEGRTAEQARTESRFLGAIAFAGAARESEGKATRMTPEEFHRKYPIHIAERESEKPSEPAPEVAAPTETAPQVKPVVPTTADPTSRPRTVAEMLVENRRAEEAQANEPVGQMSRQGNDAIVEAIANLREANEAHKEFSKDEGSTSKTASMHEMMSDQIAAVEREVKAGDAVGLQIEIAILQEMLRAGNIREARNAVKQPGIAKQLATTAQRLIDTARDELDRIESTPKTDEEGTLNQEAVDPNASEVNRNTLDVTRQTRELAKRVVLDADEKTAIESAVNESGFDRKQLTETVTAAKRAHPTKAGWAPLTLSKIKNVGGKPEYVYKGIPYAFDLSNKDVRLVKGTALYEAHVQELSKSMVDEVRKIFERAQAGDVNAQKIIEQASWYKAMRKRLRLEFGAFGDLFADLLGATSPNTPVRDNWDNSIHALRRAMRGDYDELMPQWESWANNIDKLELDLTSWFNQELEKVNATTGKTPTKAKIKNDPIYKEKLAKLKTARDLPEHLNPLKETGAKYGFNGKNLVRAFIELWRVIKDENADIDRGPTAPKAINFSGNLAGFRGKATIDVWAARLLQRLSGRARIPVAAETGVAGKMLQSGETAGQFGFGQDVFSRAAEGIRSDESMKENKILSEIQDDDLQAVVWFLEKEHWTRNDWTNSAGEGGSFELEASLAGSDNPVNIKQLRKIIDAGQPKWVTDALALDIGKAQAAANKHMNDVGNAAVDKLQRNNAGELVGINRREGPNIGKPFKLYADEIADLERQADIPENIASVINRYQEAVTFVQEQSRNKDQAKIDLQQLERPLDRFVGGLSIETMDIKGNRVIPSDAQMEAGSKRLRLAINSDGGRVVASRVYTTEGRYQNNPQRAFDIEFVTRENYDTTASWREMVSTAQATGQEVTFLSRVVRADEPIDAQKHRAGIELNFREPIDGARLAEVVQYLNGLKIDGLTFAVNPSRTVEAIGGQMPSAVGIRMQYVPEFANATERARIAGMSDVEIALHMRDKAEELGTLKDKISKELVDVLYASVVFYETQVAFSSDYNEILGNVPTTTADPLGVSKSPTKQRVGEAWQGRSVREGLEGADSNAREASRRESSRQLGRGDKGELLEQAAPVSPEFFSALKRSVDAVDAKELTGAQWKDRIATLVNKGEVKEDEIYWTGFYDFLDMQREGKITKEELAAFLENNGVNVQVLSSEQVRSGQKTYEVRGVDFGGSFGTFSSMEKAEERIERNFQSSMANGEGVFDRYVEEFDGDWYVSERETVFGKPSGLIFSSRESAEAYAKTSREEAREKAIDIERQRYRKSWVIKEVELGGHGKDFDSQYEYEPLILPNGENYREVLLTLPNFRPPVKPASAETLAARGKIFKKYNTAIEEIETELFKLRVLSGMTPQELDALQLRRNDLWSKRNKLENARDEEASAFPIPEEADALRWKIPHFGETGVDNNVLVSTRLNDRVSEQGKPALHVEEIQSDQSAKGQEKGFEPKEGVQSTNDFINQEQILFDRFNKSYDSARDALAQLENLGFDDGDRTGPLRWLSSESNWDFENRFPGLTPLTEAQMNDLREYVAANKELRDLQNSRRKTKLLVPRAPFITSTDGYVKLALKHTLMEAVKGNYKYVTFITGEQSVQRYKDALLKVIDTVKINRNEDGTYTYFATKNGRDVRYDTNVSSKEVAETFGKEAGKELVRVADAAEVDTQVHVNAVDMPVGGAGMRKFYDSMVIDLANKMSKRLGGGKVVSLTMSDGTVFPALEITDAMAAKINEAGGLPLFQAASKKPARASFNPKTFEVKLGHHSDMTSWVHESSHYLFETYHRMILDGSAPKWVADDFQTLLTFFGVKDNAEWDTLSFEARRKHYEKFSYNFEIYMAEGKAPTIALQPLFDRFKSWIIQVYTDVVKHQNTLYKEQFGEELPPLTDEVRRVMDRMLATEEQIRSTAEARDMKAMFQTQEEAGVSDAAWAEYQTVLGASHRDAVNELTARSMRDFQWVGNMKSKFLKELAKKNAATRRAVRDEVEEQVRAEPIFRAIDFLKYGMTTSESGERVSAENVGKLNLADAKAVLGDEAAKLGYGKYGMIAKDGMPADLVAELFGFKSGDELLRALAAAKKVGDEIDARTDERMMKEFGDLNDPERMEQAANAALHNDARARAVATELNFITKATTPVKEMVAAAREAAVDHINNRKIKDVKAHEFAVAEAKAARAARSTADSKVNPEAIGKSAGTRAYNKAIANGVDEAAAVKLGEDAAKTAAANAQERINLHKKQYGDVDPMESARRAKQHQLFNNQLAAVAGEVQEEVRDTVKGFSKFFKADSKIGKSRDIEMVMAARSILSAFGFGRSDKAPIDYVKQIEAFNPELFAGLEPIIARASRGAQDYREMTVAEFRALSDGVTALWNDARRDKQIMVGDKKVALAQVVGELVDRTNELGVPTEMAGDKSAPTQRQRMMRTLNGVKNMMRRVEHWCDAMDGLDNTGGPFTKYIFRPIVDAMDAYRADRTKYLKRYAELCATIELPKGRIAAPELDYTFGVGNGGIGKSELLGALLHMGNDSNMRKLLIGRKWGELDAEGNLDASRMMKFINRMVTEGKLVKADFDFVQSVWDLNEELKPMSQKSHRDLYGFYFKEVEATPLNTPFGTYRGGYVPAKADPFMVKDAQRHAKMDALEGNFNQVMPSTGLGFTKPRVEYNRPLALDLRMIGKHIDDVIRFAHVQPAIKDVLKVIGNEEFASALSKIDPTAIETMLVPFLGRAARHTAVEQGRFKAVDDFWTAVRGRTSLMFMSLNLRQLGDVGGISVALTKVKRGQLSAAMKQYLDSPHEVATMIAEASPMMDERLNNHISDTRARLDDLIGNQSGLGKAQALARKHGMFLNTVLHNQLDIVTWLGAYNQAIAEIAASAGDKEAQREAVSRADAAVRLTQGAMNPEDVAAYEQGTPFYRTITQFTTYLNTLANLNADEYGKIVRELGIRKGAGKLLQAHILAYAVPMIIFGVWTDLISGGWDDDDESWAAHALSVLFGSYFSGGIGMLPFGSQVQGVAEATIAKSIGGSVIRNKEHINVSPSINALEGGVVGAADTTYRAVSGKEITGKNIKDALTLVSLFTGIPLNPIGKTVGYAVDVNNNKIQPTGTADYIRGLITGSASPESKK